MAAVKLKGDWHYVDKAGGLHQLEKMDDARDFHNGMAAVKSGLSSKWGFVDQSGRLIVNTVFDEVTDFSEGYAAVCLRTPDNSTHSWGYIDRAGNLVKPYWYYEAGPVHNGMAAVSVWGKNCGYIALQPAGLP